MCNTFGPKCTIVFPGVLNGSSLSHQGIFFNNPSISIMYNIKAPDIHDVNMKSSEIFIKIRPATNNKSCIPETTHLEWEYSFLPAPGREGGRAGDNRRMDMGTFILIRPRGQLSKNSGLLLNWANKNFVWVLT